MDGKYLQNMWVSEALCAGVDTNKYFDQYEADQDVAREVDRMCLSCPVIKECFEEGVNTESYGVWGGIYLNEGRLDNMRNSHKNQATWSAILSLVTDGESING
jgi:hypothetical protein